MQLAPSFGPSNDGRGVRGSIWDPGGLQALRCVHTARVGAVQDSHAMAIRASLQDLLGSAWEASAGLRGVHGDQESTGTIPTSVDGLWWALNCLGTSDRKGTSPESKI